MIQNRHTRCGRGCFVALLLGATLLRSFASLINPVVLHLHNGDRITGEVIAENADRLVIATAWTKRLDLAKSQIARREGLTETATTNTVPESAQGAAAKLSPSKSAAPPPPKEWKVETQLGLDFTYGFRKIQFYYGRFRLNYEHFYEADPKQSFRNTLDYSIEYGEFKGRTYANRMEGTANTEFDLSQAVFGYNLARGGYDEVRQVDYQFEVGPGVGYHLIRNRPDVKANLSAGVGYYQPEFGPGKSRTSLPAGYAYYRLAEDFKWQITPQLSFEQKLELLPSFNDFNNARARFEAGLRYKFTQYLSLNLTALNLYDTQPAPQVDKNELRIRSSLGVTF